MSSRATPEAARSCAKSSITSAITRTTAPWSQQRTNPVIDSELLRQLSYSRPGFIVLAALPVALPHWRLRLRVELLTRREISPLEEFVLRAADEIDPQMGGIQSLLGLDDETFQDTVAALI